MHYNESQAIKFLERLHHPQLGHFEPGMTSPLLPQEIPEARNLKERKKQGFHGRGEYSMD